MIRINCNTATLRCVGRIILLLALMISLPVCASQEAADKHVIIVGIDGLSPAGIEAANTPVMDQVCKEGACTFTMRAVLPTKSSPNWTSMITGATPVQHGVTSNDWRRDRPRIPPLETGIEDIFPTLVGLTRQQIPGAVIGVVHEWKGLARMFETTAADLAHTGDDAQGTIDVAAAFLREKKPVFLFVHLDHVDHAGHELGWSSKEYTVAIEQADSLLGQLMQAAADAGVSESTTWIVAADHGGLGTRHGGESMDEILAPLMITGRGVRHGVKIGDDANIYDIAATAALLLDIELSGAAVGRPVCAALEHQGCGD